MKNNSTYFVAKSGDSNNTVNVKSDKKKGWVTFGNGDKYPIEFIKSVNRSPVATSVVDTLQSFIKGGKLDSKYSDLIVNNSGLTFGELHESACYDVALNLGCYINTKYNLNGLITEINNISFEHTRAGIPDDLGYVNEYKYISDLYDTKVRSKTFVSFDVFNPKRDIVLKQMEGEDHYNGQIKAVNFMRPNATGQRIYPIPQLNSAISYIEIDYRMGNFHVNAIKNNFHKSHIFIVKGVNPDDKDPETGETVRERTHAEINKMIGDDNTGGVFVQFVQNANQSIEIEPLQSSDDDKKYTTLDSMVVSKISTASNVPPILANIQTAGKLGDSQEIQNAVSVLNGKTEKYRSSLQSFYRQVGENSFGDLQVLSEIEIPSFSFELNTIEGPQTFTP